MKTTIVALALFSFAGLLAAAPDDLEDAYKNLKDAEAKKDPDLVKKTSADTSKIARGIIASPQPSDAAEVDAWKQHVDYAKQVDAYTEYALSSAAAQPGTDPAKVIELAEALEARNPKSQYLNDCAAVYLAALEKGGEAKAFAAATRLAPVAPNNEAVLLTLASGYQGRKSPDKALAAANKLVGLMKSKAKPEGVSAADWDRTKSIMLGRGYYIAGTISGEKQAWIDCDRNLRAALPYIAKETAMVAAAYFYLGLANYQLGKMINDRAKLQEAKKFSDLCAAIKGPYQQQAFKNSLGIKTELNGPRRP